MTAVGAIDIANQALDQINQGSISSITPPTSAPEKIVARHYDDCRRKVLRSHPWNFACTRAYVARSLTTPDFDYTDQYTLPEDCLRVLSVGGDSETTRKKNWGISGRFLQMNNSGAASEKVRYIQDVTDISLWDSQAKELLVYELALKIAPALSAKKADVERIEAAIRANQPEARSIDGIEKPPRRINESRYLAARKRGYNPDPTRIVFD